MVAPRPYKSLIDRLGTGLVPVRRLLPPWLRTAGWLLVVTAIAIVLLAYFGTGGMLRRWAGTPALAWAALGAMVTAVTAAWATFILGVPGRRAAWAWLPLPSALLWIGSSGLGCLHEWLNWMAPGAGVPPIHLASNCLIFIISFSVPLSALMMIWLRRACPLRPVLCAVMVGLASAAAAACLLEICHPYDATATDLMTHALAVVLVVAVNAVMGGRLFSATT